MSAHVRKVPFEFADVPDLHLTVTVRVNLCLPCLCLGLLAYRSFMMKQFRKHDHVDMISNSGVVDFLLNQPTQFTWS